jgi:hypothetical protein
MSIEVMSRDEAVQTIRNAIENRLSLSFDLTDCIEYVTSVAASLEIYHAINTHEAERETEAKRLQDEIIAGPPAEEVPEILDQLYNLRTEDAVAEGNIQLLIGLLIGFISARTLEVDPGMQKFFDQLSQSAVTAVYPAD